MNKTVKLKNMIAWGMGDIFGSGSQTIIGLWLLFFFTSVAGLSGAEAGSIFLITKIWAILANPIMGYITDNIRTRWGRRRVFFIYGAPFVLIYATLWFSFNSYWYHLFTYIAFNTVLTLLIVPYDTLPTEMTSDYTTRSKMVGIRMLFAQASAFISTLIPQFIFELSNNKTVTFAIIGVVFAILFSLPWIFVYKGTWERNTSEIQKDKKGLLMTLLYLYKSMFSTFRLKAFRVHLIMYVGGSVSLDIFGSVFIFYIVFVLGFTVTEGSSYLSIMTLFQFIGIPIFTFLSIRIGNGNAYKIAIGMLLIFFILLSILDKGTNNLALIVIVFSAFIGMARGGTYMIPWAVYTALPDADEALTGKRREGIYAGVMMLIRQLCQGLALFISGYVLDYFGFVSSASTQTARAIDGVYYAFLIGPSILAIFAFIACFYFKLNKKNHRIIIAELNRTKAGGKPEDVSEETKSIIEQVTGHPYKAVK